MASVVADKYVETLDLSHLTNTQSLILHAIRTVATLEMCRREMARMKHEALAQ